MNKFRLLVLLISLSSISSQFLSSNGESIFKQLNIEVSARINHLDFSKMETNTKRKMKINKSMKEMNSSDRSTNNLRHQELSSSSSSSQNGNIIKESAHINLRDDLIKGSRADASHVHVVVFVVKKRNMDKIEDILNDVSDPSSPNYGKYLSR